MVFPSWRLWVSEHKVVVTFTAFTFLALILLMSMVLVEEARHKRKSPLARLGPQSTLEKLLIFFFCILILEIVIVAVLVLVQLTKWIWNVTF